MWMRLSMEIVHINAHCNYSADSTYMLTANKRGRATCLHKNPGKLERLRDQGPPAACPDSKHSIQPHCTESHTRKPKRPEKWAQGKQEMAKPARVSE